VWIETPSNPLLRITDLRFVIDAAHRAGALALVDNTFLSPALQTPIAFGADSGPALDHQVHQRPQRRGRRRVVAARRPLHQQLVWWANALGLTGSRSTAS
jgi:cystathionine gamma-synthase